MKLIATVSEHCFLDASTVTTRGDMIHIHPPERPLFDQLCTWLDQCPPPTAGFNHWVLGIGATALCLRWGDPSASLRASLAILMDEAKPVDLRAKQPANSMISNEEMKRINIEASSNLARLLHLRHQDEDDFFDRLRRAYEWLPMPQRRVKRNWDPLERILGFMVQSKGVLPPASAQTAVSHPYRTLANVIIHFAYRNGPIESSHGGREPAYSLNHRRFTDRQARSIIRSTAEDLSPFISAVPLWDEGLGKMPPLRLHSEPAPSWPRGQAWPERTARLLIWRQYPHHWSFTESGSRIRLKQAWIE